MELEELKAGDLVELLSGGPTMTIISSSISAHPVRPHAGVICGWFNKGIFKEQEFSHSVLKKVEIAKPYEDIVKQPRSTKEPDPQ
jgi:uncharacterized protein YodC (DUF2158 family)